MTWPNPAWRHLLAKRSPRPFTPDTISACSILSQGLLFQFILCTNPSRIRSSLPSFTPCSTVCSSFHLISIVYIYIQHLWYQNFFVFSIIPFSGFPFNKFLYNTGCYLDVGQKEIPRPDIQCVAHWFSGTDPTTWSKWPAILIKVAAVILTTNSLKHSQHSNNLIILFLH